MKFAHIADCHVGGWREEELKRLGIESLRRSAEICVEENIAFLLVSGDLFNTSLPQIELIKEVAEIFNYLRDKDISIYIIPGSHDYSPSGKTMIDVLEKAGLVTNVMKFKNEKLQFTEDKTGVKITGLLGRRSGLDKLDYKNLEKKHLEDEKGFKIFMFHTTLDEFKPKDFEHVEGESYTSMPKGFKYYAGGHVHYLFDIDVKEFGKIVYPGPLFPNNFKELEEIKHGSICIIDDNINVRRVPIKLKDVESFDINVNGKNAEEAKVFIEKELEKKDLNDKIVTLRIFGELISGKVADLDLRNIGKD
ncbi:MAG: DNA repair exonuclease, partial [Nanoarchaeota archaeon]